MLVLPWTASVSWTENVPRVSLLCLNIALMRLIRSPLCIQVDFTFASAHLLLILHLIKELAVHDVVKDVRCRWAEIETQSRVYLVSDQLVGVSLEVSSMYVIGT